MKSKSKELVIPIVSIVYAILLFISSFNMRSMALATLGPAFIPRIIAVGMLILSLLIMYKAAVRGGYKAVAEESVEIEGTLIGRYAAFLSLVFIFLYIFMLKPVGFLISTTVYLFVQISLSFGKLEKQKLLFFGLISMLISSAIYTIFVFGFSLNLPIGILG